MGASIVGGHTIVGPRMEVGFTVIGKPIGESLVRKENLKPGDQLFLTKPIGIGILLAAHMRSLCRAEHYETLIDAMLIRQHDLAAITIDCGIDAGTDVTGFGLAGHLLEMLETSGVSAEVRLDAIPLLPGAEEPPDAFDVDEPRRLRPHDRMHLPCPGSRLPDHLWRFGQRRCVVGQSCRVLSRLAPDR